MTTIAAVQDPQTKELYIASDTYLTCDGTAEVLPLALYPNGKFLVFKTFAVGISGSIALRTLVKNMITDNPSLDDPDFSNVQTFFESFREYIQKHTDMEQDKKGAYECDLIYVDDTGVYEANGWLVAHKKLVSIVGSGWLVAHGAYDALSRNTDYSTEKLLRAVMETASRKDTGTGGDIIVMKLNFPERPVCLQV